MFAAPPETQYSERKFSGLPLIRSQTGFQFLRRPNSGNLTWVKVRVGKFVLQCLANFPVRGVVQTVPTRTLRCYRPITPPKGLFALGRGKEALGVVRGKAHSELVRGKGALALVRWEGARCQTVRVGVRVWVRRLVLPRRAIGFVAQCSVLSPIGRCVDV